MTLQHAVLWTDHQSAQLLRFDGDAAESQKLQAHHHPTGQHGSAVRGQHEFFAEICGAIEAVPAVLVTGAKTSLADLRHYVEKHRPQAAARIVGYEVVDHLSQNQLLALARKFFIDRERLA